MRFEETISFDDVLLKPKYSTIRSRNEVDLSVELPKGFKFYSPFVIANMASLISPWVLRRMYSIGSLCFLHRFDSIEKQFDILVGLYNEFGEDVFNYIGVSVGVKEEDKKHLKMFEETGVRIVCIDIAHLDSIQGIEMIKYVADNHPKMLLIAGNIATGEAADRAFRAGADVVKIGIGASGICTTRLEAAAGVPQLSAIMDVDMVRKGLQKELDRKLYTISDGGARKAGDCVKSLCFSDMVMMGGYFAGSLETPGEEIEINGKRYKEYHGSSTHKKNRVEGVKAVVSVKGSVLELMQKLTEGCQSGMSYQNSRNLLELKEDFTFVKVSNAGIVESGIHNVDYVL